MCFIVNTASLSNFLWIGILQEDLSDLEDDEDDRMLSAAELLGGYGEEEEEEYYWIFGKPRKFFALQFSQVPKDFWEHPQ